MITIDVDASAYAPKRCKLPELFRELADKIEQGNQALIEIKRPGAVLKASMSYQDSVTKSLNS